MILTVLGIDPGSTNMGYSVVRCKFVNGILVDFRVLENGKLKCMFKNMMGMEVRKQRGPFLSEVQRLMRKFGATHVCAERYMNRGIKGNTGELVNIMLGVLMSIRCAGYVMIPAAQWKNRFKALGDLKKIYKLIKTEAHQLDATCIGLYGACLFSDDKTYFANMSLNKLILRIEKTSTERLINRKTRKPRK